MDALQTSDFILNVIRKSNLNFSISESPFSVSITMKKTFIKEKNGTPRTPNFDQLSSSHQISEKGGKYFASNQQHSELWNGVPPQQRHVALAPGHLHQKLTCPTPNAKDPNHSQTTFTNHQQPQQGAVVHRGQIPKHPVQEISYFQSHVSPPIQTFEAVHQSALVLTHSQHLNVPLHPSPHAPAPESINIEKEEKNEMIVENSFLDENQNEEIFSEPNIPVKNRFSCLAS
jgi:hypothetical protein